MAVFGQLNPAMTVSQMQAQLAALRQAFTDVEATYQWLAGYAAADLEAAPLSFDAADAGAVLAAFADCHDLWMTAQGTTGFPTATLPYNFFATIRAITGAR